MGKKFTGVVFQALEVRASKFHGYGVSLLELTINISDGINFSYCYPLVSFGYTGSYIENNILEKYFYINICGFRKKISISKTEMPNIDDFECDY